MVRKSLINSLLTMVFMAAGAVAALAQGAPVGGQVLLVGGDGKTTTPVAGALVEVYRIDIKTKFPSDKTDKKGYFKFAGLPYGATFALSVSGQGISPIIFPNVKAGNETIVINVAAGDGRVLTEDEVRKQVASGTGGQNQVESEADKKAREEQQKKIDEIKAKNARIEETNKIVADAMKTGNAAFDAKDYNTAIAKYDEGYNADPAFIGSAPAFLNNKASALIQRATDSFNKSISKEIDAATKASLKESARNDYNEAVAASDKALGLLKSATIDPAEQATMETRKMQSLVNRKNAYRLMAQTGVNMERGKEALVAFQEYLAAETDPVKKSKGQLDLAQTMQDSQEFEAAIEEFDKILATDANNVDALVGRGLCLVTVGYVTMDSDAAKGKAQLQDAANTLQKFVDLAPDTHKFKQSALDSINELKQIVTPQKSNTKSTTTKKRN